eukprot:14636562-Heterocapsa_arctica.AAC.1
MSLWAPRTGLARRSPRWGASPRCLARAHAATTTTTAAATTTISGGASAAVCLPPAAPSSKGPQYTLYPTIAMLCYTILCII